MIDAAISTLNNDIQISGGKIVLATGTAEVVQRVKMRLNWLAGEWFLDTTKGLPWFQSLLGGKDSQVASLLIRIQINNTIGVDSVDTVNVRFAQRNLSVYAVITVNGTSIPITQGVQVG